MNTGHETMHINRLIISLSLIWAILPGPLAAQADHQLLPGELPYEEVKDECQEALRLQSGKLFREVEKIAETSSDDGKTWQTHGPISPFTLGGKLDHVAIQLQSPKYKGRIVVPLYLGMYGKHPDYDYKEQGGYAIYRGEVIRLQTHTHHPEMSGSFVCYSDDDGKTWRSCVTHNGRGFMVGYFKDGHMGHMTCEEPVVVELKDGRLMCYMRSTCGRIIKSYSEDGGEHWMKVQPTDIAMSNSPCAMKSLPGTGDLVLVWNMMSADEICKGYRRGRLCIAISKDDGDTWENVRTLDQSPGVETKNWVEPPPLQAMVRGPSGRDNLMGEIPDDFTHYHYCSIFLSEDKIFLHYRASTPVGGHSEWRRRVFPITWLYEGE